MHFKDETNPGLPSICASLGSHFINGLFLFSLTMRWVLWAYVAEINVRYGETHCYSEWSVDQQQHDPPENILEMHPDLLRLRICILTRAPDDWCTY